MSSIPPEKKATAIAIFRELLELDPSEHAVRLDESCKGDAELRAEVERLLELDARGGAFLATEAFAASSKPGEQVGPYRILQELGSGGMGVVYLAEQATPVRRRVALKVIRLGMDTREVVARFEVERQALALMEHPGIARVYDAGATPDGRPYFAMELVQGSPITTYADDHKLTVRERLELFAQICSAVAHAHHRGIIHRDLKPSNILVSTPDGKPVAKIIDFGIAKATNQRLTEKTLYTQLGQAVGTPPYMSPEQAETGAEEVDHRTDVYALGVLLYELLVGELPLDWDSLAKAAYDEVLRRIREEEPPTPSTRWSRLNHDRTTSLAKCRRASSLAVRSELRGDLDWITMKALEKERERRYASATHLADDIQRHLRGETVAAGPPGIGYRVRKYVRRNRGPVTAALAVLAVLALGLGATLYFALESRNNARTASARLEAVLRLNALRDLRECVADAEVLWPEVPDRVEAMERWLARAERLAADLDHHRTELGSLRLLALPGASSRFASEELQSRHDSLTELVSGLERFIVREPQPGLLLEVQRRLEWARGLEDRTVRAFQADWDAARASIRDRSACPLYAGLELPPQVGLVPLGRDAASGLWEFWHARSGEHPLRDAAGTVRLSAESGIVLVLIPGGTFSMGWADSPFDDEKPANQVRLDPYFISKFELTQAQWQRFTGANPSRHKTSSPEATITPLHPVEGIDWEAARRTVERLGLALPTEAQWERATRGGGDSSWWTGEEKESLAGAANLADRRLAERKQDPVDMEIWLDDGYIVHAPVGTFRANAFGLFDVAGNVEEWCQDTHEHYGIPPRPGDGLRPAATATTRVFRGGSWYGAAAVARSANRSFYEPMQFGAHLGVRPARSVTR